MRSVITSYLLLQKESVGQTKECVLPGIGTLQIKHVPAVIDEANKQIMPPADEINFTKEDDRKSPGLIKYISAKKNINAEESENLLMKFCKDWKEKINAGEKLHLATIGSIQKDEQGNMVFIRERNYNFYQPLEIEKSVENEEEKQIESEPVLTSSEYYEEINAKKSNWRMWAITLSAIALTVLLFHFYNNKFSSSSTGNQNHLSVDSAGATYSVPK